jgi:2-keto-4-pentenoate hydratase/2-oxohepta-3-ene-1,7-dioic acid hydratase in catechol pathway
MRFPTPALGVPQLVELASSFYTLYPGDVVYTGTPEGVSPIDPGDRIVATIQMIGTMTVDVRAIVNTPDAAAHGRIVAAK